MPSEKKQVAEKSNACIFRYTFTVFTNRISFCFINLNDSTCGDWWLYFPEYLVFLLNDSRSRRSLVFLGEGWWAGARLFRKTEASHWVGLSRWSTLHSLEQITVVWDCKRPVGRKSHQNENRFGSEKPVTFRSLGLWFRMAFRSVVVRWQFTALGFRFNGHPCCNATLKTTCRVGPEKPNPLRKQW